MQIWKNKNGQCKNENNKIYLKREKLNSQLLDANFWQDKDNSKKVIKEKKLYEDLVNSYNQSIQKLNDFDDLKELALEEFQCMFLSIIISPYLKSYYYNW